MQAYIALLRGINVGGHKKIKMAELRQQLAVLSFENLQTYIQSGNLVFEAAQSDPKELAQQIRENILNNYGFEVSVMVVSATDWAELVAQNPFLPRPEPDFKQLHVTLLGEEPEAERVAELKQQDFSPDEYQLIGKRMYIHCPNGYGRTKLTNPMFEKKLKVAATTRNWRTVLKLAEMVGI